MIFCSQQTDKPMILRNDPPSCTFIRTHNRENDHHKVKDVPRNCEEITTEGKDLDQAFGGEDHNEDQVDLVEDGLHALGLLICFHHHGHHVDDNEHHDNDVKGLLGNEIEEEGLESVLWIRKTNSDSVRGQRNVNTLSTMLVDRSMCRVRGY